MRIRAPILKFLAAVSFLLVLGSALIVMAQDEPDNTGAQSGTVEPNQGQGDPELLLTTDPTAFVQTLEAGEGQTGGGFSVPDADEQAGEGTPGAESDPSSLGPASEGQQQATPNPTQIILTQQAGEDETGLPATIPPADSEEPASPSTPFCGTNLMIVLLLMPMLGIYRRRSS